MIDVGTLGGAESIPVGGQRVRRGCRFRRHEQRLQALVDEAGGMMDLGTLGGHESQAEAVNTSGQVVGWAETKGYKHAF